jgi:uncharacterized protein YjdB
LKNPMEFRYPKLLLESERILHFIERSPDATKYEVEKLNDEKMTGIAVVIASLIIFTTTFWIASSFDQIRLPTNISYREDSVDMSIGPKGGHLTVEEMPEDLLVLMAGKEASLNFGVGNMDPDHDVDTVYLTIPGANITDSRYKWYQDGEHQWTIDQPTEDRLNFTAVNDVDANISDRFGDDALDSNGDDINEMLELGVTFTAPEESGIKMGDQAINLEAADEKTENTSARESFDPFPHPYIVADNGDTFIVFINKDPDLVTLSVYYNGFTLFGHTRGADFIEYEPFGFKYTSASGDRIIVIEHPGEGYTIKPLIRARSSGLTGNFTISMFNFTATGDDLEKTNVVTDYREEIPGDTFTVLDLDFDDDWIFNSEDPDIDGDGTPNEFDGDPYDESVFNRPPTNLTVSVKGNAENRVGEGKTFTVAAKATDPERDELTYYWTSSDIEGFAEVGKEVEINGQKPGVYSFMVTVDDMHGNIETATLNVTVRNNQAPAISSVRTDPKKIGEKQSFTLIAKATDADDGDVLSYTWTRSDDDEWVKNGSQVSVGGLNAGNYTFTVTVSDGKDNTSAEIHVTVEETDDRNGGGFPVWFIVLVVLILAIIVAGVIFFARGKEEDEPSK